MFYEKSFNNDVISNFITLNSIYAPLVFFSMHFISSIQLATCFDYIYHEL